MRYAYSHPNQGSDIRLRTGTTHPGSTQWDWQQLLATIALRIRQSLELDAILPTTAAEVRQLLDCDRLLIDQFGADGAGRVVVEG